MQAQTAHWIHREEVKAAVLQSLRYYRCLYTHTCYRVTWHPHFGHVKAKAQA